MMKEEDILRLKSIFKNVLEFEDNDKIEDITKLNCAKWDSLAQACLIAAVADEFSIDITGREFEMFNSYQSIKIFIESKNI